jgi:O-antigen/teichoic acid export membrane protein
MITEGIPFAFTSLGASVYMFVGPTVLKYARGDVEVGLYSAGYKLISILTLIPSTFTQVVYPVFAEFHAYATRKLEKALTDSLRAISLVSIPVAAGAWVIAPQLFAFLYEPPFRPGQMVFQVLTAANVVGYMNWVLNSYLLATRHQTFTMVLALVCGIFVTFASIVVLPGSGFRALPWIIVANELLLWISQIVFLARFGWWPFKWSPFLRQLLAAAVMVAVLLTIREVHFVLLIPVGALVYTLTLLACKGFGEQESAVLLGIVRWLSQKQPRG